MLRTKLSLILHVSANINQCNTKTKALIYSTKVIITKNYSRQNEFLITTKLFMIHIRQTSNNSIPIN